MRIRDLLIGVSAITLMTACTPASDDTGQVPTPAENGVENAENAPQTTADDQTETDRLYAFFQEAFDDELARSPLSQTYYGMTDDLEAYGQWDDVSEESYRASLQREADRMRRMNEEFDYEALTEQAQVSWRFAEFIAANNQQQSEFWDHGYIFTQFFGPHSDMPSFMIGYHAVQTPEHAEAYISRLNGMGDRLNALAAQADARAEQGVLPPAFAFQVITDTARGFVTGAPFDDSGEDSPLLADFRRKIEPLEISDADKQALVDRAIEALTTRVGPAYQDFLAMMERHAEIVGDRAEGAWSLPEGEAFYTSQLQNYTTRTDMTAEDIHQIGLSEIERIHAEMRAIQEQVGFEGSLRDFFDHLRESEEFYYPSTDEGRQRYLDEATTMIDQMMEAAPDYFGRLPTAPLEVRAVEQYRIETATGAFYETGSFDGSRPGRYYVNLQHMDAQPVYQMESLAYHEGAPGHHFQLSLAQELEDAPMFQRTTWYSAYGEGWALYSERLGKDMGFFTDPYQDFGRLSYEVFRASRLVVDTGIHHYQWDEQQAIDFMMETTPMPLGDITPEVRRYMVWPGQAVSYKIGMNTIIDLRQRTMDALGDDFDWGEFHDVILSNGSVPLTLLEENIDTYIAAKLAAQ